MIEIWNKSGELILAVNPSKESVRKCELMKEDYILLKFSLAEPVDFPLGSYADTDYGLFEVCEVQKPDFNTRTGGYDYELKLDAHYWKWKNKVFKYTPEVGGQEAAWSLTAALDVHLGIVLRNLSALGYNYRGTDFGFSIDSRVESSAKPMSYNNINILDALFSMAEAWDCDCWITDSVIHFGRCEYVDYVDFKLGDNVAEMSRSDSQSVYATRIYAFGSTRNLPSNYREAGEQAVVNGVVQKRLMLPVGTPYVDAYEGMMQEEAIEAVVVFDDIYPKTQGKIDSIDTYESTVENEDGTTTTETFYRFKDGGMNFSKDYILEGEELHIIFGSGSLNGMDFAVRFNPNAEPEKLEDGSWNPAAQLWEIVANEDYGRKLPDDVLKPSVGDTYTLYGWDSTKIAELGLVDAAEQELLEAARKYVAKTMIDPNTYTCTMFSDYMYDNGEPRQFELGDRVNIINKAYFADGRKSRIIGYEYPLDFPFDSPKYIIGETSAYSRIGDIEGQIETLTLKGQTYTGGSGGGVYLIGVNDSTKPTDRNAFSALRSDKRYIRKDEDDETEHSMGVGGDLTVKGSTSIGGILTAMGNAILQSAATVWGLLTASGGLVVQKFLKIGEFVTGITGGYIDEKGDAELNSLVLRDHLSVPEIRYNRITYFEGYNLISPGGGLKIEDYTINDDGSITVVPRLEEGEPCGQFEGDILLGYYHEKTATGDFAGFMKVQFRVTSVDYDAKTFVMLPNPDRDYKIAKNMILGQTGNFLNPERRTYILIDTRDGNNCITFYDGVQTWEPTKDNEKAWFGKKKGRTVNGIDATSYSAVLKNIIMTGRIFQVDSITGEDIRVPIDKGAYVKGQRYAYYDRVTYLGSLWLCISEAGTTQEPSATESAWLEQVRAGSGITSYPRWTADITPVPPSTILTFAQRMWISIRETSEPPLGLVTANGAYVKYHDEEGNEGYLLRYPQTQSEDWNLLLDVSGIKDGESIDVQYSSDTVSWHATFTAGDLYMRQRKGDGQWSAAMRIVGEKGSDGPYQDYQFTKNKSIDTQPTTGWQDAPPSLAEDEYLWMRTGWVVPPKTAPDAWAIVRLSGPKGKDGESNYLADLDNEMDSIPLSSDGKTTQAWTLTTNVALYYGQTRLTLTSLTTNAASPITATTNASKGAVTFTIASGQSVPERSAITINLKAPNGTDLIERTLIYTLAGVKAGAKGATGATGANGANGADAVIYRLLTSVSSVVRKKDGTYSVSSVSCRRMKRIGNQAETSTTEGTLKRSIDGGSEVVIANDAATATTAFTKSVKYLFYAADGTTLLDVETIPLVADGTDGTNGTNGTSINNLGHWTTSLGTVPKMSLVMMGGRSWLSKVATANPPLGTLTTASGRRITVKTQGGQVVYALSGKVNSTEWELLTQDSRGLSLVPTISSLQQTKLGWLNPSGYLVRACQQVGSVNLPITKYYLTTWAISSTGVKTRIISPTVTGEQAVSASKGYTQFITRMYSNYTDAYNWTDNHMAECTVSVVTDGSDGDTGRTGSEPRPRGQWDANDLPYVWNEEYHDIVIYDSHIYKVKNYGAKVYDKPTNVSGDSNWLPAQEFEFVATNLLLSDEVYTDKLTVTKVNAKSSDGATTCTIDGNTGKLTAKNAQLEGVTANNVTSKTMTVNGLTATNADVNGKVTATSGQIAGMKISGVGLTNEGFNNDAYIIMRNDSAKRFCGVGANVFPSSLGTAGLARFENGETNTAGTNYSMLVSTQGAYYNSALYIDGGYVSGFAWRNVLIEKSTTLGRHDCNVITINNSADITITLPSMELYDDGHVVRIKRLGAYKTYIKCGSCKTGSPGSERNTIPVLIYDSHAKLIPGNSLTVESECDAMELVWVRGLNYTIDSKQYYGAWIQYKIPRAW